MNYDPDIDWSKQAVKLTFALWEYRAVKAVTVGGNCKGAAIFEAAIDKVFDELPKRTVTVDGKDMEMASIVLMKDGEELIVEDEEVFEVDWLGDMCIAIEITAIERVQR